MASTFARVFTSLINPNQSAYLQTRHLPILNELSTSLSSYLASQGQISKKKKLMQWCRRTPELNAFLNKVAIDMTAEYHFTPVSPSDSGRNKILKANRFAQEVVLTKVMESQAYDMLGVGDGFGWMGKISDKAVKEKIADIISKKFLSVPEKKEAADRLFMELKQNEGFADYSGIDEDLLRPRKYRYVPATTIEIVYDKYDILWYNQVVGVNRPEKFMPDEMIHFTLMDRDGKVNGFTSVESVIVQLELLRQMWQNLLSVHKNGGAPDRIFSLENVNVSSQAYKNIEEQLMKYKTVETKHGNMLWTGKLTVQDLQQIDQMQFKDSGLYITGLIAMQWGIARSSIPYIIGGTNTKDDTGGNSERGYWQVIRKFQKTFADTMNTQLWIPYFGVKIVLENPYYQLDIQKESAMQTRLNNLQQVDTLLMRSGKQLTLSTKLREIGISDEDVEELVQIVDPMQGNSMGNVPSKDSVTDSDSKKNVKKSKKDEQTATIASAGTPTGYGKEQSTISLVSFKEMDTKAEMEFKETVGADEDIVPLPVFIKVYMEDKSYNSIKAPRVFARVSNESVSLKFRSSDFVYKTIIPIGDINLPSVQIALSNIGNQNIYKL